MSLQSLPGAAFVLPLEIHVYESPWEGLRLHWGRSVGLETFSYILFKEISRLFTLCETKCMYYYLLLASMLLES